MARDRRQRKLAGLKRGAEASGGFNDPLIKKAFEFFSGDSEDDKKKKRRRRRDQS